MNYSDDAVNSIIKAVNRNKEETYRMIFHSEYAPEDYHLLPFSKVNGDIIKQYGSAELKTALGL